MNNRLLCLAADISARVTVHNGVNRGLDDLCLLGMMGGREWTTSLLMERPGLSHAPNFRNNYLNPALKGGYIEEDTR